MSNWFAVLAGLSWGIWLIAAIAVLGLLIAALVSCVKADMSTEMKLIWVLIIIFAPVVGPIIYFILAKSLNEDREEKQLKSNDKNSGRKLYRSRTDRKIAGVFGGLAEYLNADASLLRILGVIATLFSLGFGGLIVYIVVAVIIPEEPV